MKMIIKLTEGNYMAYFSWLFFCIAPFALFCSGGGTGIIVCPVFILLGVLCRWIANGGIERANTPKLSNNEFWEITFIKRYRSMKNSDYKDFPDYMAAEEAKGWADYITDCQGGYPVSAEKYEEIAKKYGIVTKKEYEIDAHRWDRVQMMKYYLMKKLSDKYRGIHKSKGLIPSSIIDDEKDALYRANGYENVSYYGTPIYVNGKEYKPYYFDEELIKFIPQDEIEEAQKWVDEYEQRLIKEMDDYLNHDIEMPTAKMHYRKDKSQTKEFDLEYGYRKEFK